MQAILQNAMDNPACASAQEAIELIRQTLDEEYGASPDPEPDDDLQSELDKPGIDRLRAVIGFLRTYGPLFAMSAMSLEPWLTRAGLRLSDTFFIC